MQSDTKLESGFYKLKGWIVPWPEIGEKKSFATGILHTEVIREKDCTYKYDMLQQNATYVAVELCSFCRVGTSTSPDV